MTAAVLLSVALVGGLCLRVLCRVSGPLPVSLNSTISDTPSLPCVFVYRTLRYQDHDCTRSATSARDALKLHDEPLLCTKASELPERSGRSVHHVGQRLHGAARRAGRLLYAAASGNELRLSLRIPCTAMPNGGARPAGPTITAP